MAIDASGRFVSEFNSGIAFHFHFRMTFHTGDGQMRPGKRVTAFIMTIDTEYGRDKSVDVVTFFAFAAVFAFGKLTAMIIRVAIHTA